MSTLNYSWTLRGSFNGNFVSASGATDSVDGIANATGTVGEGAPLNHSAWHWGGFSHYGLGWAKDGNIENPCEKYAHHVSRHWRGEDGAHIWSTNQVTGAEGAWAGDIKCVADHFKPKGPIMQGKIVGQYPSHWIATKRSDREVDVHGVVTLMVDGGATYTAHVHEYIKFWVPCVKITRHYWKLKIMEGEYFPTHWWHKESAIFDPNWNYGINKERMSFTWHLFGTLNNKPLTADGYGYGYGYRQHQWGAGGKGFGEHGYPNLAWPLAWEGHAGLHFFTRFPKGVTNPFVYSLPEGFVVNRKWFGGDGDHWTTTHDLRFDGSAFNKKICMVGAGFAKGSPMLWRGDKTDGTPWIVKNFPQYAVAVPKGDKHIWYRATFQFLLNNGSYYSGYWEMDIHFRKPIQMPAPYVVKFWDETWYSDAFGWHFYEREEIEQSTYDKITGGNAVVSKPEPAPAPAPVKAPKKEPEAKKVVDKEAEARKAIDKELEAKQKLDKKIKSKEVAESKTVEVAEVKDAPVVEVKEAKDAPVVEEAVKDAPVEEVKEAKDAPVDEAEVIDAPVVVEEEVKDAPVVEEEVKDAPVVEAEVKEKEVEEPPPPSPSQKSQAPRRRLRNLRQ